MSAGAMRSRGGRGGALERYVVHIYRRDPVDPKKIAGAVECGDGRGRRGFLSSDALVNILVSSEGISERRTERPAMNGADVALESFREVMESIRAEMEG